MHYVMIYDMVIITHPIYYALTSLVDLWSWGSWVGWPAHSFLPWRVARRSTKRRTWRIVSLCWLLQAVSSGTIYMSRCQNSLSSLSSRRIGIAIAFHGGPHRYPWFCRKRWKEEEQKRKRKGNEEEKERKRKRKRKRKGMERKWRGREKEWKRKGNGTEEERKRKERGKKE